MNFRRGNWSCGKAAGREGKTGQSCLCLFKDDENKTSVKSAIIIYREGFCCRVDSRLVPE